MVFLTWDDFNTIQVKFKYIDKEGEAQIIEWCTQVIEEMLSKLAVSFREADTS